MDSRSDFDDIRSFDWKQPGADFTAGASSSQLLFIWMPDGGVARGNISGWEFPIDGGVGSVVSDSDDGVGSVFLTWMMASVQWFLTRMMASVRSEVYGEDGADLVSVMVSSVGQRHTADSGDLGDDMVTAIEGSDSEGIGSSEVGRWFGRRSGLAQFGGAFESITANSRWRKSEASDTD